MDIFQSTLPRRERPGEAGDVFPCEFISIHAPAKGATPSAWRQPCFSLNFNPRSREGSDTCWIPLPASTERFQSTLPRRERHELRQDWQQISRISIHAPAKGATDTAIADALKWAISIHAPAKGATPSPPSADRPREISIHAPAKGATCFRIRARTVLSISIHAPAKGATVYRAKNTFIRSISIHAPAKGATRSRDLPDTHRSIFQSTLPRRERRNGEMGREA